MSRVSGSFRARSAVSGRQALGSPHGLERGSTPAGVSPVRRVPGEKLYFVHSYHAVPEPANADWVLACSDYGCELLSAVQKGGVAAVQFHPEKSGEAGLRLLDEFLSGSSVPAAAEWARADGETRLAKRIIACLDVRTNDAGDLVVTKGDQYDVREEGQVRNLGKPVDLARRYLRGGGGRDHLPQHHRLSGLSLCRTNPCWRSWSAPPRRCSCP